MARRVMHYDDSLERELAGAVQRLRSRARRRAVAARRERGASLRTVDGIGVLRS